MAKRHRTVSDADWNQLITLASGYLAIENGDIHAAMRRALAAHVDLITALKTEQITAELDQGRVTMFVPEDGGVALRMDATMSPDSPTEVALDALPRDAFADAPTIGTFDDPASTYVLDEGD